MGDSKTFGIPEAKGLTSGGGGHKQFQTLGDQLFWLTI